MNITLEGSEIHKNADGCTAGYGIKLYKPVTEAFRQTVREEFPELVSETWVSQDLGDRAVEAMTLSLAMSTFERWPDVPGWAIPHVAEYGPQAGDARTRFAGSMMQAFNTTLIWAAPARTPAMPEATRSEVRRPRFGGHR